MGGSEPNSRRFSGTFSLRIFSRLLLLVSCKAAEGQSRLIGSSQPIVAAPGDDVILLCHLDPPINMYNWTVEWSLADSQVEYVHLYRDGRAIPDMQIPSYVARTNLFDDHLKNGNISLRIAKVTLADDGSYKCFIPRLRNKVKPSIIRLIVDPNLVKTRATEPALPGSDLKTPEPQGKSDGEDGRTGSIIWVLSVAVSLSLFLVGLSV